MNHNPASAAISAPAHSPFGGSIAARILGCPASVNLVAKVPAELKRASVYANRGTALHAVMTALLHEDGGNPESFIGQTIEGYTITGDDIENSVAPAYDHAAELIDAPGAEYYLEKRLNFPMLDAFGTADLLVRIDCTVYVVDFKFGQGVRVQALYPDGEEDVINAQLLFYAAAARHTYPNFFAGVEAIVLEIIQPNSIDETEPTSATAVTHDELDAFIAAYSSACKEALSDAPRLTRGTWCRFCPAKPICPEHTKPLLDLARVQLTAWQTRTTPPTDEYLRLLSKGLALADAAKDLIVMLREQAKQALENGSLVPGYMLSAGRAERHWGDEKAATRTLCDLGLRREDIITEEMRSPAQIEKRAKAAGIKVPKDLIVITRSGTSLVRADHAHVPVPGRDELMQSFSAALKAFQPQETVNESDS